MTSATVLIIHTEMYGCCTDAVTKQNKEAFKVFLINHICSPVHALSTILTVTQTQNSTQKTAEF